MTSTFIRDYQAYSTSVFSFLYKPNPINKKTGNIIAINIPFFKSSLNTPDTTPTTVGPAEHPKSPAKANNANIAVPPLGIPFEAILNVPGHSIPTDKPVMPTPINSFSWTCFNNWTYQNLNYTTTNSI